MASPTYRSNITYRGAATFGPTPGGYDLGIAYDDPSFLYDGPTATPPPAVLSFFPPTDKIVPPIYIDPPDPYYPCDPLMQRLMAHYESQFRGRNVFLLSDNSLTEQQPPNWNGASNKNEPYARVYDATSGQLVVTEFIQEPHVVKVFWGGVNNVVTSTEAALLTASGYTVTSS